MNAPSGASYYVPGPPPVGGTWRSPGYRSARLRARSAYVCFGLLLFTAVGLLAAHFNEWSLADRIEGGGFISYAEASGADQAVLGWFGWYTIFTIAAGVAFLMWLSRSVENAPPLFAGTPRRSPREAIGWWFVPFASFVVPYQIARDLFDRLGLPQRFGNGGRVLAWWLLFVAGSLLSGAAYVVAVNQIPSAATAGALKEAEALWMVSDVVRIAGIVFALWLIHEMQSRADARAAALGLSAEGVAVWPVRPSAPVPPMPPMQPASPYGPPQQFAYPAPPSAQYGAPQQFAYPAPPPAPYGAPQQSAYPATSPAPYGPPPTANPDPSQPPALAAFVPSPPFFGGAAPSTAPQVASASTPPFAATASPTPTDEANEQSGPLPACPGCGRPRAADSRFCGGCGRDLLTAESPI